MDERLAQRQQQAKAALKSFHEVLSATNNQAIENIVRDAAILRFQFTFETIWKYAKNYLKLKEGLEENSPKSVIRACFKNHLLDEKQTEQMLQISDDRNLAVHTYNEELADELFARLAGHLTILDKLYAKLAA